MRQRSGFRLERNSGSDQDELFRQKSIEFLTGRRTCYASALEGLDALAPLLGEVASALVGTLLRSRKILIAGNGGSAAEAQHFAAELVGRFKEERRPYAALALTTDSSIVTAVANDYGFEHIFARQLVGVGQPGDAFVALSTSGESSNLVRAAGVAREHGMTTIAVTGQASSRLSQIADLTVRVPSTDPAVTQELHTLVTHLLCTLIESSLSQAEAT